MLNKLEGKRFVIFGANGWVGKALIDFLLTNNVAQKDIIAISSSSKVIQLINNKIKCYNLETIKKLYDSNQETIFFHLAFILMDKVSEMSLEDYKKANNKIKDNATNLINNFKPLKIIYTSSGAVYNDNRELINNLNDNPYGYLKSQDEIYFSNIAKDINADILIPRIFNIAGPYINKLNVYAIGNFILQASKNKTITINAKNDVIRSYVYIFDLIEVLLNWCVDNKEDYFIFDSKNIDNIELDELARLTFETLNIKNNIVRNNEKTSPKNIYVGDDKNFNILLKRYGVKLKSHKYCVQSVYKYLKDNNDIK